jgi:trehalose 6-phosphate synthase/phosphatase
MHDAVFRHTGDFWVNELTQDLAKAYEEDCQRDTMSIPRLSVSQLSEKYRRAEVRVFILDYEGTLASFSAPQNLHLNSPQRVIDALNDLLNDSRNSVYLMSDRMPEQLGRLFDRVPGLGIIAENGCFVREVGSDDFTAFADLKKMAEWKASVRNILKYYQERIEGSSIEERHCSLIFHYDKADDKESAARQAGECANHINEACESQKVHAVPADKTLVIEPLEWSKGSAATHIFDTLRTKRAEERGGKMPDFLLVAGDDREDEVIFRWANGLGKDGVIRDVTTVSVGKRNTEAMATLTQGTSGLLSVLQKLAKLR